MMNSRWAIWNRGLALLVLCFILPPAAPARSAGVWGTRPLLSYFALTASLELPLRQGAGLSPAEFSLIEEIARQEASYLGQVFLSTQNLVADPSTSLREKRRLIEAAGYNRRVDAIVYVTDLRLRQVLPGTTYTRLVSWIETRWPLEQALHGWPVGNVYQHGAAAVRSYQVFATRYESKGGAYTVALPDQCLKFANGGLHTCDGKGYQAGAGYSVAISYKKGVGVLVGEAGPWNIDDNFWSTTADPQPRRMFADLSLGMPEAQAAYFNGYNGGKDQYGRKVTAPFAIDLAFKVGDDIGLPARKNDWITVSFLWTGDWGGKPAKPVKQTGSTPEATSQPGTTPQATENPIPSIQTSTPAADGSITHIVKAGETLWAISVAYHVREAQIQYLNNMGQTVIIYEGQKLRIREAGPTDTPGLGTPEKTAEAQAGPETPVSSLAADQTELAAQPTVSPISGSETRRTPALAASGTPGPGENAGSSNSPTPVTLSPKSKTNPVHVSNESLLIGGLIIVVSGLLLFGVGWLFSRRTERDSGPDEGDSK